MQTYGQWHSPPYSAATLFQASLPRRRERRRLRSAGILRPGIRERSQRKGCASPSTARNLSDRQATAWSSPCGTRLPIPWTYDADARTLDITVTNTNQNLSALKTIIDALTDTPFATDYLPSTATTDDVEVPQDGVFSGGTKDDVRTVVVTGESDVRVAIASRRHRASRRRDRRRNASRCRVSARLPPACRAHAVGALTDGLARRLD